MKFFSVSLFFSLLVVSFSLIIHPVFAQEVSTSSAQIVDIGYSRIDPASPLYFLKTIRENLEVNLAQTRRVKNLRQLEFATRRLRETRTLVGKNEELVPSTLERYISHLNNLQDKYLKSEQQIADDIKNNLAIHLQIFRQIYNSSSNLRTKMAVRSTMNKIIQRADVSNSDREVVCDLFTKEATSSALNQTEQVVLKDRAVKCLNLLKDS